MYEAEESLAGTEQNYKDFHAGVKYIYSAGQRKQGRLCNAKKSEWKA